VPALSMAIEGSRLAASVLLGMAEKLQVRPLSREYASPGPAEHEPEGT